MRTVVVCEILVGSMPPKSRPPSAQTEVLSGQGRQASLPQSTKDSLNLDWEMIHPVALLLNVTIAMANDQGTSMTLIVWGCYLCWNKHLPGWGCVCAGEGKLRCVFWSVEKPPKGNWKIQYKTSTEKFKRYSKNNYVT